MELRSAAAAGKEVWQGVQVCAAGLSYRVLGLIDEVVSGITRMPAHDLGAALGCGAHLLSLRREAIGRLQVETAWSLEVLLPLAMKYGKGFKFAPQA